MTSGEPPRPGEEASSVADEAMRLAETFAAWARTSGDPGDRATGERDTDARATESPAATPEKGTGCGCSGGNGVQTVCRICPVCRLAGLVEAIQPELIDKVADLLGVVATGLHDLAADRRGAAAGPDGEGQAPTTRRAQGGGIDIPVTDGADD